MIRILSLIITCVIALVGVFYDSKDTSVKVLLAALAILAFTSSAFLEVQNEQQSAFTQRALENLIRASTPSGQFASAVTKIVMSLATKRGLSNTKLVRTETEQGFIVELIFADAAYSFAQGYFRFDHEQLAEWSLLDEKRLGASLEEAMFLPYFPNTVTERWNDVCSWFGAIGKGLYPDSVRHGRYGVSANIDTMRIGIPYPEPVSVDESRNDVQYLTLGNDRVPFLTFEAARIDELAGLSQLEGSARVAEWLAAAWGPPTAFRS